jgi:hypothetical protein
VLKVLERHLLNLVSIGSSLDDLCLSGLSLVYQTKKKQQTWLKYTNILWHLRLLPTGITTIINNSFGTFFFNMRFSGFLLASILFFFLFLCKILVDI